MIASFADKETKKIFEGRTSSKFPPEIQQRAKNKLDALDVAGSLSDLASLPGNNLEKLEGDRKGEWSLRINRQWRLCFFWEDTPPTASEVQIEDYH